MRLSLRRPPIPKQTNRTKQRTEHHNRQPKLRFLHTPILLREIHEYPITCTTDDNNTEDTADAETEESEARGTSREVVDSLEDSGEGCEKEIEESVN